LRALELGDLPPTAAAAATAFRDSLLDLLDDDVVAMWVDGGTTFPDRPLVSGDLDVGVVLNDVGPDERDPDRWHDDATSRPARVAAAQREVERQHDRNIDATFLLRDEIGGHDRPGDAFFAARRHNGWPVMRMHWLAGQYVHLHGRRPDELVVAPTDVDLRRALSRELEHLERHVYEGDNADPYEATYAMWNGSRILYTLATGSPVISKRSAGAWALANVPERWHAALHAAARSYDGVATAEDEQLLRETMPAYVAMVRAALPLRKPRPPEQPPRWG
jgi:hypothetical protein